VLVTSGIVAITTRTIVGRGLHFWGCRTPKKKSQSDKKQNTKKKRVSFAWKTKSSPAGGCGDEVAAGDTYLRTMEENSEPGRVRRDPSFELARQRAELLGLPPPPEPRAIQENTIPSSPPPSYEHVLAEVGYMIPDRGFRNCILFIYGLFNILYSSSNIIRMIKSRRVRWAGHVAQIVSYNV
jgi:hypothetical protein